MYRELVLLEFTAAGVFLCLGGEGTRVLLGDAVAVVTLFFFFFVIIVIVVIYQNLRNS